MKVIRVRADGNRRSRVVATCVRNADGILISTTGAQFGRTNGNGKSGRTNQGRHYYTDQSTPNEEDAFVKLGLAEPAAASPTPTKRRRRQQPHKLPATLQALRA